MTTGRELRRAGDGSGPHDDRRRAGPVADPVVRRKLRRRPPPAIRNGRALLLGVAGYALTGLFTLGLGVIIGVKGASALFIPFAARHDPAGRRSCTASSRLTRNRQIWSWAIAVGAGLSWPSSPAT